MKNKDQLIKYIYKEYFVKGKAHLKFNPMIDFKYSDCAQLDSVLTESEKNFPKMDYPCHECPFGNYASCDRMMIYGCFKLDRKKKKLKAILEKE